MTGAALPNIQRLMSHFRCASAPVVLTQHGHAPEELAASPSPSQLVRRWGPGGSIARGSAGWALQDEMARELLAGADANAKGPSRWPRLVHKNTYDAFINTELAEILEGARVVRTVVCGVMTDFCW